MLSSQLFWRMFLIYAGLTLGTAIASFAFLSARSRATFQAQVQVRLREEAALLTALCGSQPEPPLSDATQRLLTAATQDRVAQLIILDAEGAVRWSNRSGEAALPAEEFQRASASDFVTRVVPDRREQWLCYELRGSLAAAPELRIQAALPVTQLSRELIAADARLWWGALVAAGLALAVTYVVVGRIIRPLETLTLAAQRIAAGEPPVAVSVRARNEIGTLAAAFNAMSQQLAARIADLQDQRTHVEAQQHRLETVLGAMVEGVMAIDAEQRIVLANQAARDLLDLRPNVGVGRLLWEAIRQPQLQELVREALTSDGPARIEFEVARTQATVAASASRLPGDPCPGTVLVFHDVSELRRLERLRREFVQNVSHELKTPLAAITAYAETLLDGGLEDAGRNRQFVGRIAEQSERLHKLILDLLALARLEGNEHPVEIVAVNVAELVNTCVEEHREVAAAKSITLTCPTAALPAWGWGDDDSLRTIVDNLLDNAINYTPAGGRVDVRWSVSGEELILEVQDTGVGISVEHQARIFERFFRIDKARSREHGGTGLGLAIVKHLCQMFGGHVKVTSQLGSGSCFTVTLRKAEEMVNG
jgi:two-component system phosphate regulon sensor histidine kinase PhoR